MHFSLILSFLGFPRRSPEAADMLVPGALGWAAVVSA